MQTRNEMIVEPVGLNPDTLPRPIDFAAMFGNDHPVEMEIGMGKGTFITHAAKANPAHNFFGIEWANWFWRYASDRLRRNGCLNARTVRSDAAFFVRELVPDASLAVLHVYFPDPWPKNKHHKRRLIQPSHVDLLRSRLRVGGTLHCATDWREYAEQMRDVLAADPDLSSSGLVPRPAHRPITKFEQRGLDLGHPVHDIVARRTR
jgi:tRNA (guanine-N7-)-methyltransferase